MHEPFLNSGWVTFFMAAPGLVLLLVAFLRLDSLLSAPRRKRTSTPGFFVDNRGRTVFTDPDGRPWHSPARSK